MAVLAAAVASAAVLSTAACGVWSAEPESRLVIGWSESTHRDLEGGGSDTPGMRTRLVAEDEQRRDFLDLLPSSVPAAERATVEAVDLTDEVLVIGVYNKCTETSHVTMDGDFLRFVVERDEGVDCGWAPVQIDVYAVDREGLPTPVMLRNEKGDPAPG